MMVKGGSRVEGSPGDAPGALTQKNQSKDWNWARNRLMNPIGTCQPPFVSWRKTCMERYQGVSFPLNPQRQSG